MNSVFNYVPKRVPIMKCHCALDCLKSSIVLPHDHFSALTKAGEKVFLVKTVHTVH